MPFLSTHIFKKFCSFLRFSIYLHRCVEILVFLPLLRVKPPQSLRGGQHPRPLSQILRICQLSQRESPWHSGKVIGQIAKSPVSPVALPLGELSPQVTERARMLAGGALKAPPSGELAANTVSRLRGLALSQRELAKPSGFD